MAAFDDVVGAAELGAVWLTDDGGVLWLLPVSDSPQPDADSTAVTTTAPRIIDRRFITSMTLCVSDLTQHLRLMHVFLSESRAFPLGTQVATAVRDLSRSSEVAVFTSPTNRIVTTGCALVTAVGIACFASACGSDPDPIHVPEPDAVAIVADTHANSPAPELDEHTRAALESAMRSNGLVRVVRVSGHPEIASVEGLKEVAGTDAGKKFIVKRNLKVIDNSLDTPSGSDGADDLEAVAMAADALRSSGAARPVIVMTGSGISDSGRLSFTAPGMLTANPDDVTSYLRSADAVPDLTGMAVVLVGIGYAAGPQERLDATQRENVTAIWRSVLEAGGASVTVSPDPRTGDPLETTRKVTPVDIPDAVTPSMCSTREIVFTDQSKVSFHADEDRFVDAAAAAEALTPIADWLREDTDRTALIRGTTADDRGDRDRLKRLGRTRADAVSAWLIDAGVDRAKVTAVGVGADFPEYVRPDMDSATGILLPGPASLNRSVRITLTDPC